MTPKQWERRALKAEEQLEIIQRMRRDDSERELLMARENATLRTALREIQETSNWAYGAIADRFAATE